MRYAPLLFICLLLVACGSEANDATPDTGTPDTGTPDTGTPDTGTPEAGAAKTPDKTVATNPTSEKVDADTGKPPENAPAVITTWRGDGTAIEFNAWKMGCSGCSATIQKRLGEIEGVEAVDARVDQAFVHVDIKDAAQREAIITKITKALEAPASGRKFEILRAK